MRILIGILAAALSEDMMIWNTQKSACSKCINHTTIMSLHLTIARLLGATVCLVPVLVNPLCLATKAKTKQHFLEDIVPSSPLAISRSQLCLEF